MLLARLIHHARDGVRSRSNSTIASTQQQQFARSVREHFTSLDINIWKSTEISDPFQHGWSSLLRTTNTCSELGIQPGSNEFTQLTAMLSYPMSLAWMLRQQQHEHKSHLRVHLLGARAEAMFPDFIWQLQSDIYKARQQTVHISLIGPMVVDMGSKNDRTIGNIRITHYPQTLYHDIASKLPSADVFVAFHPGWGQPEWMPSWRPTLDIVTRARRSDGARTPVFFTSFDASDCRDDVQYFEERSEDEKIKMTKYEGVWKKKDNSGKSIKGFVSRITIDGKQQHIGTFDTPKKAAEAYDYAAIQAGRPAFKLNFLDQVPNNYKPTNNGLYINNTTGFRGVCKNGKGFQARISIGGKIQCHGTFDTPKEAAQAYDRAVIQAKRPKSHLNFPYIVQDLDNDDDDRGVMMMEGVEDTLEIPTVRSCDGGVLNPFRSQMTFPHDAAQPERMISVNNFVSCSLF